MSSAEQRPEGVFGGFPFLWVFSVNHHRAPLELRESLKRTESCSQDFLNEIQESGWVSECALLDTCNRWEFYAILCADSVRGLLVQRIARHFSMLPERLCSIAVQYQGSRMVQHLFEVSSGLDSQLIGETEILGQVKQLHQKATTCGTMGSCLDRVFSRAFQSAKWVRTHTQIGKGQVSIGNVVVDLASRIFGEMHHCRVLLLGSGEVGRLTAQALKSRGAKMLTCASRSRERAEALALQVQGDSMAFEDFPARLQHYDIVIACTAAPGTILNAYMVKEAMKKRAFRPLFLIDLAMPRDVEPPVSKIPQVFLYNLDDVSGIANENLGGRQLEVAVCRRVLSSRSWSTWLEVLRRYRMQGFKRYLAHSGKVSEQEDCLTGSSCEEK
jgi:glutamyl-tRNA reductase